MADLVTGRRRVPYISLGVLVLVCLVAVFAPVLSPHSPIQNHLSDSLRPPFWQDGGTTRYLLGTDKLGRDILSRALHAARPALIVSLVSITVAAVVGSTLGIVAAYFGGWVDHLVTRAIDIVMSFPAMMLALLLALRFAPGLRSVTTVVVLILWASYARQVRGDAMTVMQKEYIALARSGGRRAIGIMTFHVLPNVVNTIIVVATLQLGIVIILEGSLSYLGAGVPPPDPTWGDMIDDGRGLIESAWWVAIIPGIAIAGLVLAANVVGEWLEERLDPRRREH
ncbi:MAG TPA: ABC transporter permease [Ilumatobacteraceae bacterium]|nr:ABC transporter permease [Ilumatobacteraceae bacterium]